MEAIYSKLNLLELHKLELRSHINATSLAPTGQAVTSLFYSFWKP